MNSSEAIEHVGSAFSVGLVGSSIYQFIKGVRNSPQGDFQNRVSWGSQAVRMNAPKCGGRIAAISLIFMGVNNGVTYIRRKEDSWSGIIAGGVTMGCLDMRRGLGAATASAVMGAFVCSMLGQVWKKTT